VRRGEAKALRIFEDEGAGEVAERLLGFREAEAYAAAEKPATGRGRTTGDGERKRRAAARAGRYSTVW